MQRLIVLAEPRSCSSYFMGQFTRSPLLHVCPKHHHELINPRFRANTRKYLGFKSVSDPNSWKWDIEYTAEFMLRYKNGAFKSIIHGHGVPYSDFLRKLPDTTFVTLRREDEASAIASIISRVVLQKTDDTAWKRASRHDPIKFADVAYILGQYSNSRYLDAIYWAVVRKSKLLLDSFTDAHVITTEDFHTGFRHELEEEFQLTFDFSDYHKPSHYSEIFTDWKTYEETIRYTLGEISGLA
jgi:hypothetical protein